MEYIVMAYSPSKGHKLRELQLESPAIRTQADAQRFAESFAQRLNQRRHMDCTDWTPRTSTIDPQNHIRTL